MDLFDLPAAQAAAGDDQIVRIIAEAVFPASFSPDPKVAWPVAQPMSPEQNRARLALACMPAVKADRCSMLTLGKAASGRRSVINLG